VSFIEYSQAKWAVRFVGTDHCAAVYSQDGFLVANIVNRATVEETNANARLVGMAPELEAAVREYRATCQECILRQPLGRGKCNRCRLAGNLLLRLEER
jgi:hypothetical protein